MIPPRGCAYVCFNTRKEAGKAKDGMKYVRLMTNMLKVRLPLTTFFNVHHKNVPLYFGL